MTRRTTLATLTAITALAIATASGDARADDAVVVGNPNVAPSAMADASAMSDAELDRLLAPLGSPDVETRRAALAALANLGADAVPAIRHKIAELQKANDAKVMDVVRAARDPHGAKDDSIDLAELLVREPGTGAAFKTALTTAALLRALTHIGTTPAVRTVIGLEDDGGGAYRAEVNRDVKKLAERAVAALIEARKDPSSEVRHFAFNQLEALGKHSAGDAVQTKDNQVLADVLRAFGAMHDMDALAIVLSFVNSDRAQVRAAARESLASFGQDAIWKLREAYSNLTGKAAPDTWSADQVAKDLFATYDKFRLEEVYALLEAGLASEKEGKHADAIAAFDKVLARQPMLERRAEMVPAYVAYAQSLEESDRTQALLVYRKAARLDQGGVRDPQIQSAIAYLDGEDMLAHGIADADIFRRALALDAGNARARHELDRLESDAESKQERVRRWAAAGAIVLIALAGILLLGGRPRGLSSRAAKT